jgi:hypothetical protein
MPNESRICRICRRILILKRRRRLLPSLPRSSIGQKRIAGPEKQNREDYGVDKYCEDKYGNDSGQTSEVSCTAYGVTFFFGLMSLSCLFLCILRTVLSLVVRADYYSSTRGRVK